MEALHEIIQGIKVEKEKALRIFSLLRDHLYPQVSLIQNQLAECIAAKPSYDKFVFTHLNKIELASYALCMLISTSKKMKDS